jgi:hypothetical protein
MRCDSISGNGDRGNNMLSEVMSYFDLVREFLKVGYFEYGPP